MLDHVRDVSYDWLSLAGKLRMHNLVLGYKKRQEISFDDHAWIVTLGRVCSALPSVNEGGDDA